MAARAGVSLRASNKQLAQTWEQADAAMSFYHARTQLKNEESKHSESAEDDVVTVASDIAAESKLLCFDELQVTDSKIVTLS